MSRSSAPGDWAIPPATFARTIAAFRPPVGSAAPGPIDELAREWMSAEMTARIRKVLEC